MAGSVLSSLKILIGADSTGVATAMDQTQAAATSWAGRITKLVGGISFAGMSVGILAAANRFDEAAVQIQRATGATGDRLKMLEQVSASAYGKTTASLSEVANVASILATRTQATGKDLEDLTLKTIKLAKTQREDVAAIVPQVTRAFGDWSVASDRQARAMDYLRVTSQQTGTQVTRLAETVVYAGAPLRMLGYDFDRAVSLIGRFEKEGVNTELVLGGMKAALQKFAKDGVQDTAKAWQDFVTGVKSGQITLSDALQLVGAKRGPDLYRAIIEGRFEIDQMVKSTQELAAKGGENMETFRAKLTKVQHQIEGMIAAHRDLIIVIGLVGPAVLGMGGAFLRFGAMALPVLTSIITALRFDMVAALSAVELRVLAIGTAATATLAIIGAVVAGYVALKEGAKNAPKENPNDRAGSTIAAMHYWQSGGAGGQAPAPPPRPSEEARWAALAAAQAASRAGSVPPPPLDDTADKLEKVGKALARIPFSEKSAEGAILTARVAQLRQSIAATVEDIAKSGLTIDEYWTKRFATARAGMESLTQAAPPVADTIQALGYPFDAAGKYMNELADSMLKAQQAALDETPWGKLAAGLKALGIETQDAKRKNYEYVVSLRDLAAGLAAAGQGSWDTVYALDDAIQKAYDHMTGAAKKSAGERSNAERGLASEIQDLNRRTFTDMERGLAQTLVNMKGWKDLGLGIVKDFATGALEIFFREFFKPLEDRLASLIGGWFGNGTDAAKTATQPGGMIPGGPGGAAGAAAGGVTGILGAVGSIGSMISGIIGNFQMHGMNEKLWKIEENTRGLLNVIFLNGPGTLVDCAIRSYQELVGIHATLKGGIPQTGGAGLPAGASVGGVNFINCTFGANSESEVIRRLRLAGFPI